MAESPTISTGFSATDFRAACDDAWLAGLYEGEGSFSFVFSSDGVGRLQLQIKMTDVDVLVKAMAIAGVGRMYGPYRKGTPGKEHWKPQWTWIVYVPDDVFLVLKRIRPHLMVRRSAQIEAALVSWRDWRNQMPTDESRFWDKVEKTDSHWLWTGFIGSDRYARCWVDGHADLAHRLAWKYSGLSLGSYKNLRNVCGVLHCVWPEHWVRASDMCKRGHLIAGDNELVWMDGLRRRKRCLMCSNESARLSKARKRHG